MSDVVARRVRVHGEVQGVFFRDSTRREASSRGVRGWVRNCADGTVEAWFEGEAGAVEALVAWARSGPPQASVADIEVEEAEPSRAAGFEVR
jgi:acylphosphatase